jgi:hypothetical protein
MRLPNWQASSIIIDKLRLQRLHQVSLFGYPAVKTRRKTGRNKARHDYPLEEI